MAYNILIVDDSSVVRKVMIKTLGMTGLPISNLYQAENGQVALDLLQNNWVDIIFLDINMPVMNGIEFMKAFRSVEDVRDVPVVVVSTEGSKERKQELDDAGVKAYLRKPVTPEQVTDTVKNLLGA